MTTLAEVEPVAAKPDGEPTEPLEQESGDQTTFYVFSAADDLVTFTHVATVQASNRDQALRKHFGKHPPLSVAVSEHAWKPRKPDIRIVVRGLTDAAMPAPGGPGPGQNVPVPSGPDQNIE